MADEERSVTIGGRGLSLDEIFPPHGRLVISYQRPFVRIEAEGPFNRELLEEFSRNIPSEYRRAASQGPYVSMVIATVSVMMPPAAIEALAASVKQVHEAGFGSAGVVYVVARDVEGRDLIMPRFERDVYVPAKVPFAWFETEAKALDWGNRLLASLTA